MCACVFKCVYSFMEDEDVVQNGRFEQAFWMFLCVKLDESLCPA